MQGGRRQPISQDLEAGGRNMFVRMDLSLKHSQKRNFFHFLEQKNQNFQKQGGCRATLFTPLDLSSKKFLRSNVTISWKAIKIFEGNQLDRLSIPPLLQQKTQAQCQVAFFICKIVFTVPCRRVLEYYCQRRIASCFLHYRN